MATGYNEALEDWAEDEVLSRIEKEFDEAIKEEFIGKSFKFAIPFSFLHTLSLQIKLDKIYNKAGWEIVWSNDYSGVFELRELNDNK